MNIDTKFLAEKVGGINGICHIGSHLGREVQDYTDSGADLIVWFEANYFLLNNLIKHTSPFGKNQFWFPFCLYNKDDELKSFNICNNGESSSVLEIGSDMRKFFPHLEYNNKISVLTKRLDTVVQSQEDFRWSDINMLVTDCQGADLEVLQGCGDLLSSLSLKVIKSEVNFGEMYKGNASEQQLNEHLSKYNFINTFYFHTNSGWGDVFWIKQQ